jgi:hypothetical protein
MFIKNVHKKFTSEKCRNIEFINQMVYTKLYEDEMNIEIYCGE